MNATRGQTDYEMDGSEPAVRIALEISLSGTASERIVDAVLSAIGDPLARGEAASITSLRRLDTRNRPADKDEASEPGSVSPSLPSGYPCSRSPRRCAMAPAAHQGDAPTLDAAARTPPLVRHPISRTTFGADPSRPVPSTSHPREVVRCTHPDSRCPTRHPSLWQAPRTPTIPAAALHSDPKRYRSASGCSSS